MVKLSDIILQEDMRRRLRKAITITYDIHLTFDDVQSGRRELPADADARQLSTPHQILEKYPDLPIMFLEGVCISIFNTQSVLGCDLKDLYTTLEQQGLLPDVLRAGFSGVPSHKVGQFLHDLEPHPPRH